jgi:hypothetical protein
MVDHLKLCKEAMLRAKPASGLRPENAHEWRTFQQANFDLMHHMLRANDVPNEQAKAVATLVWETQLGRTLFEAALDNNITSVDRGEEVK